MPGIEEAFLYGSYARGEERATSDLDLFVTVRWIKSALSERLAQVERDLGRDVNVATYERAELDRLVAEGDLFIQTVWAGPRVQIKP